jgi:hypothetical protein
MIERSIRNFELFGFGIKIIVANFTTTVAAKTFGSQLKGCFSTIPMINDLMEAISVVFVKVCSKKLIFFRYRFY